MDAGWAGKAGAKVDTYGARGADQPRPRRRTAHAIVAEELTAPFRRTVQQRRLSGC